MSAFDALAADVIAHDVAIDAGEWRSVVDKLQEVQYAAGTCIYAQQDIADSWLFVASGVTASRQTRDDGAISIARFFEDGQICGNITSAWSREYASDDLLAITDTQGVEIPSAYFRDEMLGGRMFGRYLRSKAMETLCFDKEIIVVKTFADLERRYRFVESQYRRVVGVAMRKHLAAFLGVTPEALSRFLKRRNAVP